MHGLVPGLTGEVCQDAPGAFRIRPSAVISLNGFTDLAALTVSSARVTCARFFTLPIRSLISLVDAIILPDAWGGF